MEWMVQRGSVTEAERTKDVTAGNADECFSSVGETQSSRGGKSDLSYCAYSFYVLNQEQMVQVGRA